MGIRLEVHECLTDLNGVRRALVVGVVGYWSLRESFGGNIRGRPSTNPDPFKTQTQDKTTSFIVEELVDLSGMSGLRNYKGGEHSKHNYSIGR